VEIDQEPADVQPLRGVLLDVGGTLWPESWPESDADHADRAARIGALLDIDLMRARALVQALVDAGALYPGPMTQDSLGLIRGVAERAGLAPDTTQLLGIRRAMVLPALGRWQLFAGAAELLAEIKTLGCACALLSNSTWRDAESYRRDLQDLGLSSSIDAIVTSVETGLRKPNLAIFELALAAIGCRPSECVMIGNSEPNDILPALALGMRAICVAIEEPLPSSSAAGAIAGSLAEVAEMLRSWVRVGEVL
jgi:FMN phosphatase YigB (HAD superfamily)